MRWTAVVPLKLNDASKSRLDEILPAKSRRELVQAMAQHVLGVLHDVQQIERVIVLSNQRPDWWTGEWAKDDFGQLNDALDNWRRHRCQGPFVAVHGDLPYLTMVDVVALLDATKTEGMAMATDTAGEGTNAIAVADDRPFRFQFGTGSGRNHTENNVMTVVNRPGLARDIDRPADLASLLEAGFPITHEPA